MKKWIQVALLLLIAAVARSQSAVDAGSIANTPARSGISYDALTQFLQANVSTGAGGGYNFKATLFTIQSAFSKDSLNASSIYLKKKAVRNLELGIGINKGSDGNYDLMMASFKYALINKRDRSETNFLQVDKVLEMDVRLMTEARHKARLDYFALIKDDEVKKAELGKADESFKKSGDIKDYPKPMQDLYVKNLKEKGIKDPLSLVQTTKDAYDKVGKQIDKRGLLTFTVAPGYDWNHSRFDTTSASLEYLIGFGNYKKPWNIDANAKGVLEYDSTSSGKNLSRSLGTVSLGLNKVLICDSKLNPILEWGLALEYDHFFNGVYKSEEKDQRKLVSTLRIHLSKEISIPIVLKYDLNKPNLFGIFRLTWNLEGGKKG
jgi:hypothetical protein